MAAKRKKGSGVEWVGGIAQLASFVNDEGDAFQPEVLLWLHADRRLVLGTATEPPGVLLAQAAEHLAETIARPLVAGAPAPARVRVASEELAASLRAAHPALEIVCAPTPELDGAVAALGAFLDREVPPSYLAAGADAGAMASFFRAAAVLYRAAPWKVFPAEAVLGLTVEAAGAHDAALSIMGQGGGSFGLLVLESLQALDAYAAAGEAMMRGGEPPIPQHFAISFERGAELDPPLRKEIAAHRWEVAGPKAYPWVVAVDSQRNARPPSAKELVLAEALALALAKVASDPDFVAAASVGPPATRTLTARTHAGEVSVVLHAPHPAALAADGDALDRLAALGQGAFSPDDDDARRAAQQELFDDFLAAHEGKGMQEVHWIPMVLDLAAGGMGLTLANMGASALREVLFAGVTRSVVMLPSQAAELVAELRAFYRWAHRAMGLAQGAACLRMLGGKTAEKLATALGDRAAYGPTKVILMDALAAGVDLGSPDAVRAFMETKVSTALGGAKASAKRGGKGAAHHAITGAGDRDHRRR